MKFSRSTSAVGGLLVIFGCSTPDHAPNSVSAFGGANAAAIPGGGSSPSSTDGIGTGVEPATAAVPAAPTGTEGAVGAGTDLVTSTDPGTGAPSSDPAPSTGPNPIASADASAPPVSEPDPVDPNRPVRIYLIGDSTMQDYSIRVDYLTYYYPQAGWGEMLQGLLTPTALPTITNVITASSVEVINWARGGRSSRSFWQEGRWQQVQDLLEPGDYVFIQFGHNDEAGCAEYPERCTSIPEFQQFLRDYVDSSRLLGAIPLLITPINRNYPWANGRISNVHGEYPAAMKAVAMEKHVPVIDGTQRSLDLFNEKGQDFTTYHYFLMFAAGAYPDYRVTPEFPNGSPSNDGTHLLLEGATAIAQTVVEGLQDLVDIDVSVEPATCGTVSGSGWYEKKYTPAVSIAAQANPGCTFQSWSGDIAATGNPAASVPVDRNRKITAHFLDAR